MSLLAALLDDHFEQPARIALARLWPCLMESLSDAQDG
ncbi:MAG: hypothetical protein OJF52_003079 [Nitrospira sp.]|jgi:hypothetical protein|nr:MAG: hypothetical protein OJF52_003079 [Nitrospira sp.]